MTNLFEYTGTLSSYRHQELIKCLCKKAAIFTLEDLNLVNIYTLSRSWPYKPIDMPHRTLVVFCSEYADSFAIICEFYAIRAERDGIESVMSSLDIAE